MTELDSYKDVEVDNGEEVYSKVVRAGRRTYFFDVKSTRNDDYYLTITESRKKQNKDGTFFFDKHKVYLYKEDFEKFSNGLIDVISFVKEKKPDFFAEDKQITDNKIEVSIDDEFDRL